MTRFFSPFLISGISLLLLIFAEPVLAQDDQLANLRAEFMERPYFCSQYDPETHSCDQLGTYEFLPTGELVEDDEWIYVIGSQYYNVRIRSTLGDMGHAMCYDRAEQQLTVTAGSGATDVRTQLLESVLARQFQAREDSCFELALTGDENEYLLRLTTRESHEVTMNDRIWSLWSEAPKLRPQTRSNETSAGQ